MIRPQKVKSWSLISGCIEKDTLPIFAGDIDTDEIFLAKRLSK